MVRKKQNQKTDNGSVEKIDKDIKPVDTNPTINEGITKHNLGIYDNDKYIPEWYKNMSNVTSPWYSHIDSLQSTFAASTTLAESMKNISSISDIYRPISTTLNNYSNLSGLNSSIDLLSTLNNPIAGYDALKYLNLNNPKPYDTLIDFKFDNTSKINDLEKKLKQTISKLKDIELKNESLTSQTADIQDLLNEKIKDEQELLLHKQLGHIITRISDVHLSKLMYSGKFFKEFEDLKNIDAVVISIDIRKSTELMLKAVSPQAFAEFITELSNLLSTCVKLNYGVFDKFTGDGILAFFPKFFSGEQALLYALKTATLCHEIFERHYKKHEFSFQVFNKSIGLGIGIECGEVAIVNNGVELTIVGTPVVYACRLGGAPSNTTLIGQKAMQTIYEKFDRYVEVESDELNIKHEGIIGVYKLKKLKHLDEFLQIPDWSKYIIGDETNDENEANTIDQSLDAHVNKENK